MNCCHGDNYQLNSPYNKVHVHGTRYQGNLRRQAQLPELNLSSAQICQPSRFESRRDSRRVVNSQQHKYQPDWFKARLLICVNAEVRLQRELADIPGTKSPLSESVSPPFKSQRQHRPLKRQLNTATPASATLKKVCTSFGSLVISLNCTAQIFVDL